MNFKKILDALTAIDTKQTLAESEKKETTWTDMSGKKNPATQVKGDKYTGKEADKEDKKKAKEVSEASNAEMDSMLRMAGLAEAKKPDADGDGVPDWADKKPGKDDKEEVEESFMDKIKAGAKAVGKAITGPDDEELLQKLEKETGGKRPEKKEPADVKESAVEAMRRLSGQISECGMMSDTASPMSGGQDEEGVMSINTSSSSNGNKNVTITADGKQANQLLQMLKLAGLGGMGDVDGDGDHDIADHAQEMVASGSDIQMIPLAHRDGGMPQIEVEVDEEYANEPKPQVQPVDTQLSQGTDMHREKTMHKHNYRGGDNPMAMREAAELAQLEKELFEELDSIKIKKVTEGQGPSEAEQLDHYHDLVAGGMDPDEAEAAAYGSTDWFSGDDVNEAMSTNKNAKQGVGEAFANRTDSTTKKDDARYVADFNKRHGIGAKNKKTSFAALAPPKDKITFADNIAGAKKKAGETVDEGTTKEIPTGRMHKGTYGNTYNAGDDSDETGGGGKKMKPDWSAFTKPVKTTAVLPTTRHKMDKKAK